MHQKIAEIRHRSEAYCSDTQEKPNNLRTKLIDDEKIAAVEESNHMSIHGGLVTIDKVHERWLVSALRALQKHKKQSYRGTVHISEELQIRIGIFSRDTAREMES